MHWRNDVVSRVKVGKIDFACMMPVNDYMISFAWYLEVSRNSVKKNCKTSRASALFQIIRNVFLEERMSCQKYKNAKRNSHCSLSNPRISMFRKSRDSSIVCFEVSEKGSENFQVTWNISPNSFDALPLRFSELKHFRALGIHDAHVRFQRALRNGEEAIRLTDYPSALLGTTRPEWAGGRIYDTDIVSNLCGCNANKYYVPEGGTFGAYRRTGY